ncbi:salicylate synthase [Nocardia cyriacigeorgica]|uniref:salicylate synthase n=1 Tax=Nocardia cyriacigeorgica TaxID=135487 RepID=UPI001894CD3C|nr:salicylate synthase [Nocardia cyriacigeorgica]MBF6454651.1 salicylate synthase [Nocardia cyriacigeorgica]MBF6478531.1 salicylate synthase [Nocardia cyriacigeorgica]MBF6552545.1 salicylate synthase [Nocardia cyriacigeorgica]
MNRHTTLDADGYVHSVRPHTADPLALTTAIAASGQLTDYIVYEQPGRWYLAGNPVGAISVGPDRLHSTLGGDHTASRSGTPWPHIRAALDRASIPGWKAYGWACFELWDPRTATPGDVLAHIMVPGVELEITATEVQIRSYGTPFDLDLPDPSGVAAGLTPMPVGRVDVAYLARVGAAQERIDGGEFHKVIMSRRVDLPFAVDMPATFAAVRRANTPARSFLLDLGGWQAAGVSPETVLEADGAGLAATQPLAGTRARTGDPVRDRALREELLADPKEVYEHAISVRLAFDELAGVGTATRVGEFLAVKERGSVQHLASRVETLLPPDRDGWDALAAVFPAITASGIPKAPACAAIDQLEPGTRGLYSGTVLRADHTGVLDAALVLRAVYQRDGRAWLRAGAGIVTGSTPEREHEETCEKLSCIAPYLVADRAGQPSTSPPRPIPA